MLHFTPKIKRLIKGFMLAVGFCLSGCSAASSTVRATANPPPKVTSPTLQTSPTGCNPASVNPSAMAYPPSQATADSSEITSLPYQTIDQGAPLGDTPEQSTYTVVTQADEWNALTSSLPAAAITTGKKAGPDQDTIILAVFAGLRPSSGYTIEVEGIYPIGNLWVVCVTETPPQADQVTEPATTLPYHLVSLSRQEFAVASTATFVFLDNENNLLAKLTINPNAPNSVP
jgi:PrcB C-terminal